MFTDLDFCDWLINLACRYTQCSYIDFDDPLLELNIEHVRLKSFPDRDVCTMNDGVSR